MIKEEFNSKKRMVKTITLSYDLAIVGGGMSGVCAAITAARAGIKVILVQDRPVLGGNASSEVRLWILGATSHMGNNNRWSREGGVIDEILVENMYRNKEGNPVIFDSLVLEKVKNESNITLLLNTAVYDVEKSEEDTISRVFAFCSQNETFYEISAPLFCDASGDGIVAYLAGAAYRMGAEERTTYGEKFAPDVDQYGELLGHSIYFYSKDTGKPIQFIPPAYALTDITQIPRFGNINSGEHGCKFWWLEYGGRKDTIHDTEDIKWELWRVVYGVWSYIKNSGEFPEAENLTLEWVGVIPGKRESRRFVGHYTLTQQDIIEQRPFDDAVAFGGWAIDLHPADGVYSSKSGCTQYHSKGVYEIPYRCFISKDIKNLFFAGRNISTSHVAHGSSRVMATSAFGAQAVGMAAAQCIKNSLLPIEILEKQHLRCLQQSLNRIGQSIPRTTIEVESNLAGKARIEATGSLRLSQITPDGEWYTLNYAAAQLLPLEPNISYEFEIQVEASEQTTLSVELRYAEKPTNYTPELIAGKLDFSLQSGQQAIKCLFPGGVPASQYGFLTFLKNEKVKLKMSNERYTGIVSVFNKFNYAVNNHGKQMPPEDLGIDAFEFWCPQRRPEGQNIAMNIKPAISVFDVSNLIVGYTRPTTTANAWVTSLNDKSPQVNLIWDAPQTIREIILYFDTDFDHPMESVQMGHPENIMPFCVREYTIKTGTGKLLYKTTDNHQTVNRIVFECPEVISSLSIEMKHASDTVPVSLFYVYIQ